MTTGNPRYLLLKINNKWYRWPKQRQPWQQGMFSGYRAGEVVAIGARNHEVLMFAEFAYDIENDRVIKDRGIDGIGCAYCKMLIFAKGGIQEFPKVPVVETDELGIRVDRNKIFLEN